MVFYVGMFLDINEECVGEVTQVTDDALFIKSECFTGWARQCEIEEAIASTGEDQ